LVYVDESMRYVSSPPSIQTESCSTVSTSANQAFRVRPHDVPSRSCTPSPSNRTLVAYPVRLNLAYLLASLCAPSVLRQGNRPSSLLRLYPSIRRNEVGSSTIDSKRTSNLR